MNEKPAFAYLVTGRSPQSRERKATTVENSVIMGPTGNQPYDPLRYYTAVKYDNDIGLAIVSNGIQTEAIYETYKLIFHTDSPPETDYLTMIMNGARSEPDSLHTPRIAGVITNIGGRAKPVYIIGIKTLGRPATVWQIEPKQGVLNGISTYHGNMESPGAYDIDGGLAEVKFDGTTPDELTGFIYKISAASHQGDDIRVCAIGGVCSEDNNRTWKVALINRHKS
jgi:IMP cyclohydrolase